MDDPSATPDLTHNPAM